MKKIIVTGVMVIIVVLLIILGLKNSERKNKKYEYYDMQNNYGTSLKCELKDCGAYCKTDGGWELVNQFSEVSK